MAKITMKKEVGIEELINKISKKEVRGYKFEGSKSAVVRVDLVGYIDVTWLQEGETFEIEVEREIDLDTKLKNLLVVYGTDYGELVNYYEDEISINQILKESISEISNDISIYIKDGDINLIWENGYFLERIIKMR